MELNQKRFISFHNLDNITTCNFNEGELSLNCVRREEKTQGE